MTKKISKNIEIVVVGTGIAGSIFAYELKKRKINFALFTDQKIALRNTSSLSYGHFRIATEENFNELVEKSVFDMGQNEEKMRFVYSRSNLVKELLDELGITYEKRSFGIIPTSKIRGGLEILRLLHSQIQDINNDFELINFSISNEGIKSEFISNDRIYEYNSKYLVLATGGYGGSFEYTNNIRYNNYRIFDMVKNNGGKIINTDCIFRHPFGYNNGHAVLIGSQASLGDFLDENQNYVFDEELNQLIKDDAYHERFHDLLKVIETKKRKGERIFFVNDKDKLEIIPTVHYTSGGIQTSHLGRIDGINNAFAIGECQANGHKNQGRLPGYPFTSAVVYGKELGEYFYKNLK